MQLPKLNCVFFDDLFPVELCPMQSYQHKLKRESELVLRLMAQKSQEEDVLIHSKLDLILLHTLQQAHPDVPQSHLCRLGLDAVILPLAATTTSTPPCPGDALLMSLYVDVKEAFVIHLPLMVSNALDSSIEGHLSFTHSQTQFDWEQWVFQRHRQSIQQQQSQEILEMSL